MTTYVGTPYASQSSAPTLTNDTWRIWMGAFNDALSGAGLVQTSDTGQQDPATSLAPTSNSTDGGYSIWRFADSRQGVDPIFLKIVYRRGGTAGSTQIKLTVGQGSNGAGTLTGVTSSEINCYAYTANQSATYSVQNYACHTEGNCWISDVVTSVTSHEYVPRNYFNISRTRDPSTGAFDGRGVFIAVPCWPFGSGGAGAQRFQTVRWLAGNTKVYPITTDALMVIGGHTSDTNASGELLAWPMFYYDAGVKQCWATFGVKRTSFPASVTTFTASPYGVSHTWVSWATAPSAQAYADQGTGEMYNYGALAMLWE